MTGSKRSEKRNWQRGRGPYSFRSEVKASLRINKKYLNRKVRRANNIANFSGYKRLAGERAYDLVT